MGQLSALFIKNWILYKRNWVGSLFEILIPILFVAFVVVIRRLAVTTDYPQTQFVGNNLTFIIPNNLTMYPQALKYNIQLILEVALTI
jgi:hypothetical protein